MVYSISMMRKFIAGAIMMVILIIALFYVYVSISEQSVDSQNKRFFSKLVNGVRKTYVSASGWNSMETWMLKKGNEGFLYSATFITNRTAKNLSDYGGEPSHLELRTCEQNDQYLPFCFCLIKFKYLEKSSGEYYHDYSKLNDNNIIFTNYSIREWNRQVLEGFLAKKEDVDDTDDVYKYPKVLSCKTLKSMGCDPENQGVGPCLLKYNGKNVTMLFAKNGKNENNLTVDALMFERIYEDGNWTNTVEMTQGSYATEGISATQANCLFDNSSAGCTI